MKYSVIKKPKWTADIPTGYYGKYDALIEDIKKLTGTESVVMPMSEIGRDIQSFKVYINQRAKAKGCAYRIKSYLNEEDNKLYIWKLDKWK